jgi:hypothetical protein
VPNLPTLLLILAREKSNTKIHPLLFYNSFVSIDTIRRRAEDREERVAAFRI